jgi:hypothetical protein
VSAPTTRHPDRRPKLGERAPSFARKAVELREHIASLGAEKVAEVLNVRVVDLASMLEGRALPPRYRLHRLRKLSGDRGG